MAFADVRFHVIDPLRNRRRRVTGRDGSAWAPGAIVLLTFLLVCVAWVFFRAHSFGQAFDVASALFGVGPREAERLLKPESIVLSVGVTGVLLFVHWSMREISIASVVARVPWWVRSLALAALVLGIIGLSGEDRAFIYFQF